MSAYYISNRSSYTIANTHFLPKSLFEYLCVEKIQGFKNIESVSSFQSIVKLKQQTDFLKNNLFYIDMLYCNKFHSLLLLPSTTLLHQSLFTGCN
jgi:hypothetical protein